MRNRAADCVGWPPGPFCDVLRVHRNAGLDRPAASVAPFLSWLRALNGHLPTHVDFFYASVGEAPFAEEIRAIAARHTTLHAHLSDRPSRSSGRSAMNSPITSVTARRVWRTWACDRRPNRRPD